MSSDNIYAIDIGSQHIAIVGCEYLDDGEVAIAHARATRSEGIDRGYIRDVEQAGESLKKAVTEFERKSKKKIDSALFSIGGIGLVSQFVKTSIEIRKRSTEITKRDLSDIEAKAENLFSSKYPNKKILHVIPVSYRVDDRDVLGSPVGMFGNILEAKIIMLTVPEHHYESLLKIAELAGVSIDDIAAAPLADAASTLSYEQRKQGALVVNIGSETTQMSTYEQGILTSLKVIPIGSSDITNDLALGLQIPIEDAHMIKHGKNQKDHSAKKIKEIIHARIADIIDSVQAHLKSIKKNRLLPAGVHFTGNGSLVEDMDEFGKQILKIPATRMNMKNIPLKRKRKIALSPKFSTAYGLCVMNLDEPEEKGISWSSFRKKLSYFFSQLRP